MNKYSIILPVRNGGEYVKECVRSILAQTIPHFNLHVLDNASTDGTPEWIQSLADSRIVIYPSGKSLTIEENWTRISSIPKNEFITLIGHDDLLHPHYLEEMERLIGIHPKASLYQTHFRFIDSSGGFLRNCLPMDEVQYAHEFLAAHMCHTMDSMGTGYMMRSADYDRVGGMPDLPNLIFADYILWIMLSRISYKATSVRECFSYRIHQSVSKTTKGEEYIHAFEKYVHFLASTKTDDPFREVIGRYGTSFLLYYCQSLAHRLLKTSRNNRTLTIKQYIEDCRQYARLLVPDQDFDPMSRPLIKVANQLDSNFLGRQLFGIYQKIKRK
jgi:glycosyltransferase involved in cell wall biosynthesis